MGIDYGRFRFLGEAFDLLKDKHDVGYGVFVKAGCGFIVWIDYD